MTARLFCEHCDKFYEVNLEDVRLMLKDKKECLNFAHNTYFYKGGCFFETLKKTKKRSH